MRALRWLPAGQLASAGEDGSILVTNPQNGTVLLRYLHTNFATDVIALDSQRVLSSGYDGVLRIGEL